MLSGGEVIFISSRSSSTSIGHLPGSPVGSQPSAFYRGAVAAGGEWGRRGLQDEPLCLQPTAVTRK